MSSALSIALATLGCALFALVVLAPRCVRGRAAPDAVAPRAAEYPGAVQPATVAPAEPAWPLLLDPRACECDPAARLDLVTALATVRAPWAVAVLHSALVDETDASVRAALDAALCAGHAAA